MHYHGYQKRSNHFLKKKHENNFAHNLEIFSSSFHDCRNWALSVPDEGYYRSVVCTKFDIHVFIYYRLIFHDKYPLHT
jgi:hypothetical protein